MSHHPDDLVSRAEVEELFNKFARSFAYELISAVVGGPIRGGNGDRNTGVDAGFRNAEADERVGPALAAIRRRQRRKP